VSPSDYLSIVQHVRNPSCLRATHKISKPLGLISSDNSLAPAPHPSSGLNPATRPVDPTRLFAPADMSPLPLGLAEVSEIVPALTQHLRGVVPNGEKGKDIHYNRGHLWAVVACEHEVHRSAPR
jgi:hypothetical protein